METMDILGRLVANPAAAPFLEATNRLMQVNAVRRPLVRLGDELLRWQIKRSRGAAPRWRRIEREHLYSALAVLHTMDRQVGARLLHDRLLRHGMDLWGKALCVPASRFSPGKRFKEKHGCEPPWFLVISPGHACNLSCPGCYAGSERSGGKLSWPVLDRIVSEARTLWGVPLVVFSGGEPFAYSSEGKGIIDIMERHEDCIFLAFTNGTLIDGPTARRLGRLCNFTPAIAVDGMRESTDLNRGAGVFDHVLRTISLMHDVSMPVGISATATRYNCAELVSDEFIDFFFREMQAFYGFYFQYMPMGRCSSLALMPSPEQRMEFWRRQWELVERRHILLFDFWHYGTQVKGCLSAGRARGYLHVDWEGRVMPCVFSPYAAANIFDIYSGGGDLDDVWEAPFFRAIRAWQSDYGYGGDEPSREGNWLSCCPIRDHYPDYFQLLKDHGPEPTDEAARAAMEDDTYFMGLADYGSRLAELSQPVWEQEYLGLQGPETSPIASDPSEVIKRV